MSTQLGCELIAAPHIALVKEQGMVTSAQASPSTSCPPPVSRQRTRLQTAPSHYGANANQPPVLTALCRQHEQRGTHFSDTPTPAEHLLFLHGFSPSDSSRARYVGLRRLSDGELSDVGLPHRLKVSKNPLSVLMEAANELAGESNVFVTQASFRWGAINDKDRHRCTVHYTESIGVIFVDLDVYNTPIYNELGGDPQAMTRAILAQCDQAGIARPVLIHSGQGFYAYWVLVERYRLNCDPSAISRWQQLQARLIEALSGFGADTKVKDTTRVLRLVGTINGKNGQPVTVTHDDGATHAFSALETQTQGIVISPAASPESCSDTPPSSPKSRPARKEKPTPSVPQETQVVHPVVIPDHVSDAISRLVAMRDQESLLVSGFTPFQRRYWRAFSDIVELIRVRKGLRHGQRDEVLFWLCVTRYHSGQLSRNQMAQFSALCAPLCDTPLDLFESGMLASLLSRIQSNRPCNAKTPSTAPIRHRERTGNSMFAKVYSSAPKRLGDANAKGEFARSMVYTPTYKTLRKKLAITAEEQTYLTVLISEQERTHRKYLASPTAARLSRHAQAVEIAQRESMSAVLRDLPMSRATAYRVTQSVRSNSNSSVYLNKSKVYRLRAQGMSLRGIASEVGVAVSTVSRWIKQHSEQLRARELELELSRAALSCPKPLLAVSSSVSLSSLNLSFSCVPLSHFKPLTMEGGEQRGRERALLFKRYMYLHTSCIKEVSVEIAKAVIKNEINTSISRIIVRATGGSGENEADAFEPAKSRASGNLWIIDKYVETPTPPAADILMLIDSFAVNTPPWELDQYQGLDQDLEDKLRRLEERGPLSDSLMASFDRVFELFGSAQRGWV